MGTTFFNPLQLALKPLLEQAINEDADFAQEVIDKAEKKNWEECCEYILGESYKYAEEHRDGNFGLAGADGDTLIGMIKHYWDEDEIEIHKVGEKAKVEVSATPHTPPAPKSMKEIALRSNKADKKTGEVVDMFGNAELWED